MKVVLRQAHTHAGIAYAAGMVIDVPLLDAVWLKSAGLIDYLTRQPNRAPAPEPSTDHPKVNP
ncbi:MAG: hypothetical protein JSS44_09085 [Proteobacteria bacterium]|nr:hypothetical protein [Pseudomonadota bacterium]MBS0461745.1 hypothetical protein [Pseudomonadota bacterium]MBS0501858.1 hypothetical protein [Pseudomonadota bacterium]